MNIGHEDDPLKPYMQPAPDFTDEKRLGKSMNQQGALEMIRLQYCPQSCGAFDNLKFINFSKLFLWPFDVKNDFKK